MYKHDTGLLNNSQELLPTMYKVCQDHLQERGGHPLVRHPTTDCL